MARKGTEKGNDFFFLRLLMTIVVMGVFFTSSLRFSYAEEGNKKTTKGKLTDLTMEELEVKGDVEKPEFINIIQRRRVEFKDKGELNYSFSDKIYKPVIKGEFEESFFNKVQKNLRTKR